MPGCQIIAAKNGHVFYKKSFGNHTYDSLSKKVENLIFMIWPLLQKLPALH